MTNNPLAERVTDSHARMILEEHKDPILWAIEQMLKYESKGDFHSAGAMRRVKNRLVVLLEERGRK